MTTERSTLGLSLFVRFASLAQSWAVDAAEQAREADASAAMYESFATNNVLATDKPLATVSHCQYPVQAGFRGHRGNSAQYIRGGNP